MPKKRQRIWQRLTVIMLSAMLIFGSVIPSMHVMAGNTNGQGQSGGGGGSTGTGSGVPKTDECLGVNGIAFTFWEQNASGQWELKYGIVQLATTANTAWANGTSFTNAQGRYCPMKLVDSGGHLRDYISGITVSNVSTPAVNWDLYGQNYFVSTYNSISAWASYSDPFTRTFGAVHNRMDLSKEYGTKSDVDKYNYMQSQLDPDTSTQAAMIVGSLEMAYQSATGSLAQLQNQTLEIGVSEIRLNLKKQSDGTVKVRGVGFPENINTTASQETVELLFPQGQQACFTYTGGAGASGVCTYDIRNHPSSPSHAEDPWQNPQIDIKKGDFYINKIYVYETGYVQRFYTSKVCRSIMVSDEVGKIDDDWDFQYWCLSTQNSNYSLANMQSNPNKQYRTGYVDMITEAASLGNTHLTQINLLFVKTSNGQPGSTIMTEQTLGIGTTQTFDYIGFTGRDEVGYDRQSAGTCGTTWQGPPWISSGYNQPHGTWEDADLDGYDDDGDYWTEWIDTSHWTDYTCGASQTKLAGCTTTRYVSVGTWNFKAATFGNPVGVDGGATVSRSGNSWSISRSTSDINPSHTVTGSGTNNPVHVTNHNPTGSALTVDNGLKIQITGFALYRNSGLGDLVEPYFNNSAYIDNHGVGWTWYHPYISRIGSPEFTVLSSTYGDCVATTTSRKTSGGGWTPIYSADTYGSRGFRIAIGKGASTSTNNRSNQDEPSTIGTASMYTTGGTLLDEIVVWSYLAHPNITPAEFGHKLAYDVSVRPIVVMRMPFAQTMTGAAAQWDSAANRDKAAYVMVKGEYNRELKLSSWMGTRAYPVDGIQVTPNTLLNDARVGKYFVDTLKWQTTDAPYAIPGGSVIYIGQGANGQLNAKGIIGTVDVEITMPFIGQYSPFRYQIDGNAEQLFDVTSEALNVMKRKEFYEKEAVNWVKRYYGEPCADDSYYTPQQSLDDYFTQCEESLEHVYLALYVYDKVGMDSYEYKEGQLYKKTSTLSPSGIVAANGKFTLDGVARTAHDDTKYSFGGIDDRVYVRVVRDYYPKTQASYIGIDTCGGSFSISSDPLDWDFCRDAPDDILSSMFDYFQPIWVELGKPNTWDEYRKAIKNINIETNPTLARYMYETTCTICFSDFGNAVVLGAISEAYALQKPLADVCDERVVLYTAYYKDGTTRNNCTKQSADPTLQARVEQLSNSVEHDVGNDFTWYADGDWYNEGVLPYYNVYCNQKFHLVTPANASTVIDPSLMGISAGKDDMLGSNDTYWNGAVVGLAFDNMTQSEFEANIGYKLPDWGSANTRVELANIGASHPIAISNTSVNDIY